MEKIKQEHIDLIVMTMADIAIENRNYFSELDGVMGDADFGVSLSNGFEAVMDKWDTYDRTTIGNFLLNVSSKIIGNTGGCSGPIWGTLFMKCGIVAKNKKEIDISDIVEMLESATKGIMERGGAKPGDKTLLDAIYPAIEEFRKHSKNNPQNISGAFQSAAESSYAAIEGTRNWMAKRGRQSFTGDRSIGTLDPGIVAFATMMKAIAEKLKKY